MQKIKEPGLVEKVISTNTHADVQEIKDEFLEVRSIANLLATQLQ